MSYGGWGILTVIVEVGYGIYNLCRLFGIELCVNIRGVLSCIDRVEITSLTCILDCFLLINSCFTLIPLKEEDVFLNNE